MGTGNPESFEGQVRRSIVSAMVSENATAALSKIAVGNSNSAVGDLYFGLSEWAAMDSKAASNWYMSEKDSMSGDLQDSAARSFSMLALSYGELQGARTWANEIKDDGLRQFLLEKIGISASSEK